MERFLLIAAVILFAGAVAAGKGFYLAVVPAQAYPIFKAIAEIERSNQ